MENFDQMINEIKRDIGELDFNEETEDLYLDQVIEQERLKQQK